jgi:hypothetical protein
MFMSGDLRVDIDIDVRVYVHIGTMVHEYVPVRALRTCSCSYSCSCSCTQTLFYYSYFIVSLHIYQKELLSALNLLPYWARAVEKNYIVRKLFNADQKR